MSKAEDASSGGAGSASGGAVGLESRVRRLVELADQSDKARAGGRLARILIFLLLIVVIFSVGLRIYGIYGDVQRKLPKYQAAFMEEMAVLGPKVAKDLYQVAVNVAPDFRKAIESDIRQNKDGILKVLTEQRVLLFQNATKNFQTGMEKNLRQIVARQENQLQASFPKLKDPKAMDVAVDTLTAALAEATGKLVDKRFNQTLGLLGEINEETILLLPDKESQEKMRAATEQLFRKVVEAAAIMAPLKAK